MKGGELSWQTRAGTPVLAEVSDALPLVDVSLVFRFGALIDAPGKEGTARLMVRLLRSGAKGQSVRRFDEAIEGLGATLSAEVAHGGARFTGSVLAKNLAPFLELVIGSIAQPAMRKADLDEARREGEAELLARQDDDRWLAALHERPRGSTSMCTRGASSSTSRTTRRTSAAVTLRSSSRRLNA